MGAVIVDEALDLGVSASKTSPFNRPDLGEKLAHPENFDAVIWWRFDRALRRMDDMHALSTWAAEHRKVLIFAEGPGGRLVLDFRSGVDLVTRLLLQVFSFAAEFEAQSIKERVTSAQAAMKVMPLRWRGSKPAYGYVPAELAGGGWTLVQDADAVPVIARIVKELKEGQSPTAIALGLTVDEVATPADHWSTLRGRKVEKPRAWTATTVANILRSPALIGWKVSGGKAVLDSAGSAVLGTTEPIMGRAEYDAVQALLTMRSRGPMQRKDTKALLLDVALCASCGRKMYLNTQESRPGQRPTYKCNSKANGHACAAPVSLRADWLEAYVTESFLDAVGGLMLTRTVKVPGYDPALEIAELTVEMDDLRAERPNSEAGRVSRRKRLADLDARMALLEATPKTEATIVREPTGRRIGDEWEEAEDSAARRSLLIEAGAVVRVAPGRAGGWRNLDLSRVEFDLRARNRILSKWPGRA